MMHKKVLEIIIIHVYACLVVVYPCACGYWVRGYCYLIGICSVDIFILCIQNYVFFAFVCLCLRIHQHV